MKNYISNFSKKSKQNCSICFYTENNNELSDDETDGPIDFIRQVVDSVREEFNGVIEEGEKNILHLFTKILAIVLSVKADISKN